MPGFSIPFPDECHEGNAGPYDPPRGPNNEEPVATEETARNHRYLFETLEPLDRDTGGITNLLLFAYKATRPAPEIDEITIHSGQDEIYRPGKNRWKPIELTFYERLTGNVSATSQDLQDQAAKLLYKWWGGTDSGTDGGVIHLDASSIGINYQKSCQLAMLDGLGQPVWTYYMSDCWPTRVTPSDLDYSDTNISSISVTLRYSKAVEKQKFR